ncbi:hypothetical protein OJ998_12775 [Solirubrobacter taibaiensis]|nr:hypothetical protein [Solirubrobacter taibaiensis]
MEELLRVSKDLGLGGSEDAFAFGFEPGLAVEVVALVERGFVPFAAVDFDEEPHLGPPQVGDERAARVRRVDEGWAKPALRTRSWRTRRTLSPPQASGLPW